MNQRLQSLVDEIYKLNTEFRAVAGLKVKQSLGGPASNAQIKALEKHLEVKLPPSYRDLLGICNGWTGFSGNLHLLSVEQQIEGEYAAYVHQWKGEQWAAGEPVPVEAIVFGIALNTNKARLFDIDKADKAGEMEAIWWDDGEVHRYKNLIEMFEEQVRRLKFMINRKRRQKR